MISSLKMELLIALTLVFASFLLISVPYTVSAKSRVVLDSNESGTGQYYYSVLDACTPYPYHSHENITDVIHSASNASKTMNNTMGCASMLDAMKFFCQDIGQYVKPCSDPRFTNFLVSVYGTQAFEQALEAQKAAAKAHSIQVQSSHPCPGIERWSEVDQKCISVFLNFTLSSK